MATAGRKEMFEIPKPNPAPRVDDLPHALTFFVSCDEHRRLLRVLKRIDADRRTALLKIVSAATTSRRLQSRDRKGATKPTAKGV
jgi:hypothetical protein